MAAGEKNDTGIRKGFDLQEAVILLDIYLKFVKNGVSNTAAAKIASQRLRALALSKGQKIDESFRNVNGIQARLREMSTAYENLHAVERTGPKIFKDAVDLYNFSPAGYEWILARFTAEEEISAVIKSSKPSSRSGRGKAAKNKKKLTRKDFDARKAALLHEEYLSLIKNGAPYADTARVAATRLSAMAAANGMETDESCRNIAAIEKKLRQLDLVYNGTEEETSSAPKILRDTVALYTSNRKEYKRILGEQDPQKTTKATKKEKKPEEGKQKKMEESLKASEQAFFAWISKRLPPAAATEVKRHLNPISMILVSKRVLPRPILETTDAEQIDRAFPHIKSAFASKKMRATAQTILTAYAAYLRDDKKSVSTTASGTGTSSPRMSARSERKKATQAYEKVLEQKFPKGFRLGSNLEMKKFRRYYEELNGSAPDIADNDIENTLRDCCIVHENKLFLPKTMLSDELKAKLLSYIDDALNSGKSAIYFEALFQEFSEDFLGHHIYDADMLKSYIEFVAGDRYYIGKSQLSKEAVVKIEPIEEIRSCLTEYGRPMETEELCRRLSHLPQNKISAILGSNLEFVRNGKGEYFHADMLALSDEELEDIAGLAENLMQSHSYISGTELMNALRSKYPQIYEGYSGYSDIGWRDALKYKFGERFSFTGNIISRSGETISMSDVFAGFASEADAFTMDELDVFAGEMGTRVYFEPVYQNALRVSRDNFVSKKRADFRVKDTDKVLDLYCLGNYVSLAEFKDFGIFPDAGFPWTVYLLESYAASYSEKYTLLHAGYSRTSAAGAIAKKSAGYGGFDDMIVDVLADSGIALNKQDALEFLVSSGYTGRRTYSNIEQLLIRASAQRNRKEKP